MKPLLTTLFLELLLLCAVSVQGQNPITIDSLLRKARTQRSNRQKVNTYVEIATLYNENDSTNTMKYARKAIRLADKINFEPGKLEASLQIGRLNVELGHYLEAEQIYENVRKRARKAKYKSAEHKALEGLGIVNRYRGNYNKALRYHFQGLMLVKRSNNQKEIANNYNNISNIYKKQGNYEKALDYYFKSLKIRKQLGDTKGISSVYNNIGNIHERQGNYKEALNYHSKSLRIKKELKDKKGTSISYNNIGSIYEKQGKYKKALKYYMKFLHISKELGNSRGVAMSYNNIGLVYYTQENYEKALHYSLKSLEICKKLGLKADLTHPLILTGKIYQKQQKWQIAQRYLNRAFLIARETGIMENTKGAVEMLALVAHKLGNYQTAYEMQVLFKEIADSLQNITRVKKITQLEENYKFQQEKDSIQFANQTEKVILKRDIESRRVIQSVTYIGLGLLGLLLLTLFLFLKSKIKSNRALRGKSQELLNKNEEINQQAKEIEKLNRVLAEDLDKASRDLLHKNQKLEDYAYYNSHQTRKPIANLLGLISILDTDNIDEETLYILQKIKESATKLDDITKEMNRILEDNGFFIERR